MGETIIPRWEWRTFGTHFGAAEEYIAKLEPTGIQESDETYLISPTGDTVKIRAGLMDIKLLREVGRNGLERWEPVLKAEFPLSGEHVAAVFAALREPMPPLDRERYTLEQFLTELVEPAPGVREVPVSSGGCATASRAAPVSSPTSWSATGSRARSPSSPRTSTQWWPA